VSAIGFVLSTALLVYALVLVARAVLDWVGVLGGRPGGSWVIRARRVTYALTEPVLAPVRRVLPPLRLGSVGIDLAFAVVLIAVLILRSLAAGL
jgi:YggT family protein